MVRFTLSFILLLLFWLLLSGHFDPLHLTLGILSSFFISFFVVQLMPSFLYPKPFWTKLLLLFLYFFYTVIEVITSNIKVARQVFRNNPTLKPGLIQVSAPMKTELGIWIFAHSITLTPGTIAGDIEDKELTVHLLSDNFGQNLESGSKGDRARKLEWL